MFFKTQPTRPAQRSSDIHHEQDLIDSAASSSTDDATGYISRSAPAEYVADEGAFGSAEQADYTQAASPYTVGSILKKTPVDSVTAPRMVGISGGGGVDYIFQDEQLIRGNKGWGQKLCYNTGLMYGLGLCVGGAWGMFEGVKASSGVDSTKLKLNSFLNATTRRGPLIANSAGVTTMLYTTLAHSLSRFRGEDDVYNHIGAGTLAGVIFKSTAGIATAAKTGMVFGGIVAVGAGLYSLVKEDRHYA